MPKKRQSRLPVPSPDNHAEAESFFFAGTRYMAEGKGVLAETCLREAIRLVPDFAAAHANLGLFLDQDGQQVEAEVHFRHAIACDPGGGQTYLNLGVLLARQKRFVEAEAAYRKAIDLMPDSPVVWSNLGVLQACRKQEVAAEESYRQATALDPAYRLASFNLSYLLLRQGRLEEGWQCLEARNWYEGLEKFLPFPRWHGEVLAGKSLLIGIEAGHGDMIQFCRYAAVLKARGATRIGIICQPALKVLFATLDDVTPVIALDEPLSGTWDYWTPPLSIPFHCQTRLDSIPARLPYLRTDPARLDQWARVLDRESHPAEFYVGLAWKGNPRFENDVDRSLPNLATLAELGQVAGIRFISLQKGVGEDEAANPPDGFPVLNLGPQIADFADAAAIVANLDLVISVDTAVAHLAGALGKPCWVMLPEYKTDWRWLTERDDSPWYPGVMRLFRQRQMGEWSRPVGEMRLALEAMLQKT